MRVDLQLMGPRGQSLESRTAVGQLGGHTPISADVSHTAAREAASPCSSWSLSKQGPGHGGTREREMENRSHCHVSVQSTSKLGPSAPSTGHRHEGRSMELSPFPAGRDQNVSGWNSPKSSSLLGFAAASCSRGQEIPSKQLRA